MNGQLGCINLTRERPKQGIAAQAGIEVDETSTRLPACSEKNLAAGV
ncbi:hypothetical protein ACFS07_29350 [Undibacterium arcticum]